MEPALERTTGSRFLPELVLDSSFPIPRQALSLTPFHLTVLNSLRPPLSLELALDSSFPIPRQALSSTPFHFFNDR